MFFEEKEWLGPSSLNEVAINVFLGRSTHLSCDQIESHDDEDASEVDLARSDASKKRLERRRTTVT